MLVELRYNTVYVRQLVVEFVTKGNSCEVIRA